MKLERERERERDPNPAVAKRAFVVHDADCTAKGAASRSGSQQLWIEFSMS